MTVTFEVSGDWVLLPDAARKDWGGTPVAPPAAPLTPYHEDHQERAREADRVGQSLRMSIAPGQKSRDPSGRYWIKRPDYGRGPASYERAEFRAKRGFDDVVLLWPEPSPSEAILTIDVHAANLAEPIVLERALRFEEREARWDDDAVLELLDAWLADAIKTMMQKDET